MKKQTRKQKYAINPAGPQRQSHYALKIAARKQLARKLNMPINTPLPILNSKPEDGQRAEEAKKESLYYDDD